MKESIGNTLLFNIVIVFVIVFIGLFVTSITYSKGYKVKNKMIEIIEKEYPKCNGAHNGDIDIDNVTNCNKLMMEKINDELSKIGYRMAVSGYGTKCENDLNVKANNVTTVQTSNRYQVCFTAVNITDNALISESGNNVYYVVNAYMYLDVPLLGDLIQIPVRGETKTFVSGLTS